MYVCLIVARLRDPRVRQQPPSQRGEAPRPRHPLPQEAPEGREEGGGGRQGVPTSPVDGALLAGNSVWRAAEAGTPGANSIRPLFVVL